MTEAKPQNYWISPTALRITLNALSDADYMQASAASGAMIMCYMKGIDGLEYDHGHNYKRWPLKISPTYFTTATKKYVYVRIPRPAADPSEVDTDVAQVVFPSEHIDIYGYSEGGTLVGDEKYYYIYLQGIISASEATTEGLRRHWEQEIVTGTLASDEAYDAGGDGEWWRYNPVTDTVEFLKTISHAVFEFLEAAQATIHNLNVTGTLDAIKGYIDDLRSHNYQSGLLDGSGFRLTNDNGDGSSELEVDFLKVRKKATFMELEVREETFVGGNQHYSPAGSILYRVDYLDVNDGLLGYSVMKVPFLLKRFAFLGRIFNYAARKRIRRKMTDEEWKQCHHFRCYLLADDGTTATRNWWKVGDQAKCQTFNKAISAQNKRDNGYNWKKDHFNDDPSAPMPKYTTIEGPFETSYYWRLISNVGSEKLEDGHAYDFVDMPYECWDVTIGGRHYYYTDDEKASFRDGGSGIPVAGDTIVCMGNRTDEERMNMISLYTSGDDNNPPAIKGYRGIHTFKIKPENRVFEISPNEFLIRSRMFKLLDDSGYQFPVPLDRGEWKQGTRYHWYDRVSWKGSIWLCQVLDDEQWEDASGNRYEEWRVEDIEYGEGEFDYYIDGAVAGTDHYYKKGKVGSTVVYYVKRYTYSEPDRNNDLWLREVAKGTEITDVEVAYAASKSGTEHPADDNGAWKTVGKDYATPTEAIAATGIDDPEHKNGVYLWTRTKTFYDDANDPDRPPTVEYTVVRWGIDADGIYQINSYYLSRLSETPIDASSDSYPMPGDTGWKEAAANAKWFDAFSACAAANGGVGSMQGWMVWEKTVIIYDKHFDKDGKEDTKPDIITYKSSRIGQDGQIGMEEYYMLAESDDFNTVFGSLTPDYSKIGIRWYNQSNPAAENWRLSDTTPNIDTAKWKAVMPAYDESQPKKKYLWNFEQRIDGQGTEYATKPICIGNHARGIKGVLELYALSASQTPMSADRPIPSDINSKNTWGVIPTTGFQDPQVWGDEKYDRAPTEALPYQWNWTRTLYSAADANGLTYEDHYHVSAVRGTKGEDGSGIEYIYKLTSSADAPATPTGEDRDDFVPDGWTDNPQGVSFQNQYEWVSERKSSATPSAGGYSGGHSWGPFSAPKLWSKWGKNGMDGDGVEYVFARTTSNSAPSITNSGDTDPRGRTYLDDEYLPLSSAGRCTDDPVGVSHDYPYEWVSKRTKGSPNAETGVRQWQQYSGTMALWSTFAENNVRLDISNEMDMVQTDSTGKPVAARTVTTVARLFDGTTEIQITPRDLTVSGGDLTPTKTADGKGVLLTWTFSPTAYRPLTTAWEVNIGYAYKGETYKAVFTIAPSLGEVVWQLKPDMSAIPFQRGADNVLTPASRSVGLKLIMMDHDNTQEFSSVQQGIIVRYAFDAMPASSSAGTGWSSGAIAVTNDKTNLFIALFNSSGTMLDRETVPVIKDGEKGEQGDQGPQGRYEQAQYAISAYKTAAAGAGPADCGESDWKATAPVPSVYKPFVWKRTRTYDPATGIYSSWSYIRETGEDGAQGKTGLWYRYLGVWGVDVTSVTNTNTVGYYVRGKGNDRNFYMNVKDAGVENKTEPSASADGWEVMNSVFEYFMTKVTFADSAYLGSFIFNGDWMISQKGRLGGSSSEAYEKFDPAYPTTSVNTTHTVNGKSWDGYNFVPNFAVDGKKGFLQSVSGNIGGFDITDNGIMYNGGTYMTSIAPGGIYLLHSSFQIENSELEVDGGIANLQCGIVKKTVSVSSSSYSASTGDSVIMNQYDGEMKLTLPSSPSNGQELWVRNNTTSGSIKISAYGSHKIQREDEKDAHSSFTISGSQSQRWYHAIYYGGTWFF